MSSGRKLLQLIGLIILLFSISLAEDFFKPKGFAIDAYGGWINASGQINNGDQYGLRTQTYLSPYFNAGFDFSIAQNQRQTINIYRFHPYIGLHARFLKYVHPYVLGSLGMHTQPRAKYWTVGDKKETLTYLSASIKFGLATEIKNFRLGIEYGGGGFGTGHEELSATIGYTIKPIPAPNYLENFRFSAGTQAFIPFIGPYEKETDFPGMDFTITKEKNGKTVEYNLGLFATEYKFNCGVFSFGKGWRINNDNKIFDYLTVTPGYQILIWTEGDPDLILPAASLGLGLEYKIGPIVPFVKTRSLLSYSFANELLFGTSYSYGIGIEF